MQTNSTPFPEKIMENVASIGDTVADTAAQVRDKASAMGRSAMNTVTDAASGAATYVNESSGGTMLADLHTLVKKRPAPYLLAAATFGFFLGRAWHAEVRSRRGERSAFLK